MAEPGMFRPDILAQIRGAPRLADTVYLAIRDALESGRIPPDGRLREEALAQELGVCRITVRTALGRLVSDGLAIQEPYRGVRAVPVSPDDVEDLSAVRAMMEGHAVELAAERISSDELHRMSALLQAMDSASPTDLSRSRLLNREFHWVPIRASGRPHLVRILTIVWDLRPWYVRCLSGDLLESSVTEDDDHRDHSSLVQALERRDGPGARRIVVRHINEVEAKAMRMFRIAQEQGGATDRQDQPTSP